MTTAEATPDLDWLLAQWAEAAQIERDAKARKDELAAMITPYMYPGIERSGVKLVRGARRFDPELALSVLSDYPEQLRAVSRLVPSAQLANKLLPDELLARCQKTGKGYLRLVDSSGDSPPILPASAL